MVKKVTKKGKKKPQIKEKVEEKKALTKNNNTVSQKKITKSSTKKVTKKTSKKGQKKKQKKGFTFVELMAVIVLIAVLISIGVSTYTNVNESSKRKLLEAKIMEIKAAGAKWAKENNITSKRIISVNTLVIEGYLSADENKIDELAFIENPVTGENMICNVLDISFEQGEIKTIFDDSVSDCSLATQVLTDTNINIKVIDENNIDKTGVGHSSIAKWSNKNVIIVVNSAKYDPKAVSISYDFEGNTITKMLSGHAKYTGSNYLSKSDIEKYYNVFAIDASLLLDSKVVVTYNIAGEGSKSRAYTIRIDKEEATAMVEANNEWIDNDKQITVKVDDGKGSGSKYFYVTENATFSNPKKFDVNYRGVTTNLPIGRYYIWTEDKAGNRSQKPKIEFEVNNVDMSTPECEVIFHGTPGDHGWFISDVTPAGKNSVPASISGVNIGVNTDRNTPEYSGFAQYNTQNEGAGAERRSETPKNGVLYYCHVKSLAGMAAIGERILYLDKTSPTINVTVANGSVYSRAKVATVTIRDTLSGLNETTVIRYGLSTSSTAQPTSWTDVSITATEQTTSSVSKNFTTSESVTGDYYMWIDASQYKDYAGNHTSNTDNNHMYVYGPFKFDNTPPSCSVGSVTNQCTESGITAVVSCSDGHSGVASCAGVNGTSATKTGLKGNTSYKVVDAAGNSNNCGIYVLATKQYQKYTCNTGKRCEDAGCETANRCDSADCETYNYCQHEDCGTTSTPYTCYACCPNVETSGGIIYRSSCPSGYLECNRGEYCSTTVTDSCRTAGCGCKTRKRDFSKCGCEIWYRSITKCGCETWNTPGAWTNTPITGCDGKQCKVGERTVYHSEGTCNGDTHTGGTQTGSVGMCGACTGNGDCSHGGSCSGICSNSSGSYRCCITAHNDLCN